MAIQGTGSDTRQTGIRAMARKGPFATSKIRSRLRKASIAVVTEQCTARGVEAQGVVISPFAPDLMRMDFDAHRLLTPTIGIK